MSEFVKVAAVDAVEEEQPLVIEYRARRIAIYREGERFYAIEDICPHMGAFLSHGFSEGSQVICPWHNWKFDLASGECLSNNSGSCIQTFPVQIVDGGIWLPARLPDDFEEDFEIID
ncbi:MAG: Rieske (2Fe-2S) protein [Acidobacteriota bacterium]